MRVLVKCSNRRTKTMREKVSKTAEMRNKYSGIVLQEILKQFQHPKPADMHRKRRHRRRAALQIETVMNIVEMRAAVLAVVRK